MKKDFLITTAIDYANGSPHVGHAYEKILTDIIARHKRLLGYNVKFITGLDEHGQKVQINAKNQGVKPIEICNNYAKEFNELCRELYITNDDYIRTTEPRHKNVVRKVLEQLYDRGEIYKSDYNGFYSIRQEQFVTEKERINGEWPEFYGEVTQIVETNYFFKLSKYQDWLVDFIKSNEEIIYPRFRSADVLNFLKEPLNDLCISRPKERLSWGIELPFDSDFVTYVWFDALINYITAFGYGTESFEDNWPVDYHVIGKDILSPPHAVYWLIMLKSLGLKMPKHFLVHGWWLTSGSKMSKSHGDTIDPLDLVKIYGSDSFRYFMSREMNVGQDSEFSLELFKTRYNSDLANDLGNLLSRLLNMGHRYCNGFVPEFFITDSPEKELIRKWDIIKIDIINLYDTFLFQKALIMIFSFITEINRYTELRAPWKLSKSSNDKDKKILLSTIGVMAEALRLSATALIPIMPNKSKMILNKLGIGLPREYKGNLDWGNTLEGKEFGDKEIIFPKNELG